MIKTLFSTALIFTAMSVPVSSAQHQMVASPYIMQQQEGNEIYRPLFYVENVENPLIGSENNQLEYNNLIFTESSEYSDIFIDDSTSFITGLWSEYMSSIENLSRLFSTTQNRNASLDNE